MKKKLYLLGLIFVVIGMLAGCFGGESYSKDVPEPVIGNITITQGEQITGEESINQTESRYDVGGTDLGSIFEFDGTYYYVFGDTFGANSILPPGAGENTNWRSNVVAYSTDTDPSDGIEFDGFLGSDGVAKEIIPSLKTPGNRFTSIPTYGIAVNDRMYLYYMSVDNWGAPGEWDVGFSRVYHSIDKGETWAPIVGLQWEGDSNFVQVAIVEPEQNEEVLGEDIYFYGVGSGRYNPVQLMKVNENDIEDIDEYRYFTGVNSRGVPQWSEEEADAKNLLDVTAGEISVVYNEGLDRWIMTYINGTTTNIDMSEAENPWGPWTEPRPMVTQSAHPGLYGSYMHPMFIENDGKTMYFVMSKWGPYNAFIMKADFELN